MRIFKTEKVAFSVTNHAEQFLNGLTANSLDKPQNAFVNIHGRIVATFDQLKIAADEFLVLIEKSFVENVFSHIDKFVRLSQVHIERKNEYVYFDLDGDVPWGKGDYVIQQKKGRLIITQREWEVNVSCQEFSLFRLKCRIPWHGVDYRDEFLLNVSTEDFVSFTKGCFLGQEPIAKVYNRSKPTWRLEVRYEDECDEEARQKMTSKVKDPGTHRVMGFVFIKNE